MIEESKHICKECGHETNVKYKFCINCGQPLSNQLSDKKLTRIKTTLQNKIFLQGKRTNLPMKTKISIIVIVSIITLATSILIVNLMKKNLPATVDPEAIEWIPLEVTNSAFNVSWAKIVESNYAVEDKNLYFLIKWNGSVPTSIVSNEVIKPHYLIYRKVNVSWVIYEDGNRYLFEGELRVGDNNFFLFEFVEEPTNFLLSPNSYPFMNETTVAFTIIYTKGVIPIESLSQISTTPTIEYVAYHKFQSNLQSITEIAESPSNSVMLDGNISEWSNSNITYNQMNAEAINSQNNTIPNESSLPHFENIRVTRTTEGLYGVVSLDNKNFTKLIKEMGTLKVEISWATTLVEINGTFEADYTFGVSLTYDNKTGYSIQTVYITLVAGTTSPTIFKDWPLPNNHSGTADCLEFLFPVDIISDLYSQSDEIYFCTIMIIEWK